MSTKGVGLLMAWFKLSFRENRALRMSKVVGSGGTGTSSSECTSICFRKCS